MKCLKRLVFAIGLVATPCFSQGTTRHVDQMSITALGLECPNPANPAMGIQGTGFIVSQNGTNYLISNWHVLAGREWPSTNTVLSQGTTRIVPTNVIIFYRKKDIGASKPISEALYDSHGVALWFEHPLGGTNVDVVALPLTVQDPEIQVFPLDLKLTDTDLFLGPASTVSIIGFPRNITKPGDVAIWKTGNVASDPELDFGNAPRFLVGVIVRPGMSGSPVIERSYGPYLNRDANGIVNGAPINDRFLGVLSAYEGDNELAFVWKPSVVSEILAARIRSSVRITQPFASVINHTRIHLAAAAALIFCGAMFGWWLYRNGHYRERRETRLRSAQRKTSSDNRVQSLS
jgi:hypothetical protein